MNIRQAVKGDADQLFELEQDYYQERLAMLPETLQVLDGTMDIETIHRRIFEEHRTYVATLDERIVGYIVCRVRDVVLSDGKQRREGRIADLYVAAGERGKGYAAQLYETACTWFTAQGCKWESLSVFAANPARKLYEKWGFVPYSTEMVRRIK